ncbi:MAG: tetratricopeptide repeat protein [Betaproteobacteria bacterium]
MLFTRASVLFDWGRIREACNGFLQAQAAGLARTSLYLNLAWSYQLLGQAGEAEPFARKAIGLEPDNAPAHFGLGTILQRLERHAEAILCFERVLELAPEHAQAAAGIARCHLQQKDYAAAEDWYQRAIALEPLNPQFRINLGAAIVNQGRYAESLVVLGQAAELELAQGTQPVSMIDTGFALVSTGRYQEALALFRRNLPQLPDSRAHGYYAFLLLALGRFREGWAQYEFRWMSDPHLSKRPGFSAPQWAGQDLAGKTILLVDEQGAGDIINFGRYAIALKALGATVILQVRPEIAQLAKDFAGVDLVIARPAAPPPFDYYVHLMSLPHVLRTEVATIPVDIPYVRPDSSKVAKWSSRIAGDGLKVGLAWAGNPLYPRDNFRSVDFARLSRLWDIQGVRFFSLQKPLKEGEIDQFPKQTTLENLGPEFADFADSAAVIAQLDLVVCVDTAIAHLAGAMGKPVWLMLPEIGDYRWLDGREDSPWYPTMRLFRQRVLGEWDEVVARVAAALQDAVAAGRLPDIPNAPQTSVHPAPIASDAAQGIPATDESAAPNNIARVVETRYGILQYLPDVDRAAQSIEWYGEYLQPQLDLLSRLIPTGAQVVEAGSGVGEHAVALAGMVGVKGHVWVYETRPIMAQILRQNLEANRATDNLTLMRRDLGAPEDPVQQLGEARLSMADTVDALQLDRLDLLKVRYDAPATEILDGASESLWRLRPALFVAAKDATAVTELAERLKGFGYRCWRMDTPIFNLANFNRRDADIFDSATALAVLGLPEEVELAAAIEDHVAQRGCVELS